MKWWGSLEIGGGSCAGSDVCDDDTCLWRWYMIYDNDTSMNWSLCYYNRCFSPKPLLPPMHHTGTVMLSLFCNASVSTRVNNKGLWALLDKMPILAEKTESPRQRPGKSFCYLFFVRHLSHAGHSSWRQWFRMWVPRGTVTGLDLKRDDASSISDCHPQPFLLSKVASNTMGHRYDIYERVQERGWFMYILRSSKG